MSFSPSCAAVDLAQVRLGVGLPSSPDAGSVPEDVTGRLPNEVLCAVFNHLRETWPMARPATWKLSTKHDQQQTTYIPLGWVNATHVCRRWRHISIAHRLLWTTLSLEFSRTWDEFLARSGSEIPLTIQDPWMTFDGVVGPDEYYLHPVHIAMMNEHAHRISGVTAMVEIENLRGLWSGLASPPVSLTSLELCIDPTNLMDGDSPLSVYLSLVLQHAPNLRVLRLDSALDVDFNWDLGRKLGAPANALRVLKLDTNCAPTNRLRDVLRSLRPMVSLQELELRDATLPPMDVSGRTAFDSTISQVHMPCLSKLTFIDCSETSLALWNHLDTSNVSELFFLMSDLEDTYWDFFLSLFGMFLRTQVDTFTSLSIRWGRKDQRIEFELQSDSGCHRFDLSLQSEDEASADVLVRELVARTPMTSLQSLTLEAFGRAGSAFSIEGVRNMFDRASNLRYLTISGDILCPKICAHLGSPGDETLSTDHLRFRLFPLLEYLDICSERISLSHLSHRWVQLLQSGLAERSVCWRFKSKSR